MKKAAATRLLVLLHERSNALSTKPIPISSSLSYPTAYPEKAVLSYPKLLKKPEITTRRSVLPKLAYLWLTSFKYTTISPRGERREFWRI